MNPKIWQILSLIGGGAAKALLPGAAGAIVDGVFSAAEGFQAQLEREAAARNMSLDQLSDEMLTVLEVSAKQHHAEMLARRKEIEEAEG